MLKKCSKESCESKILFFCFPVSKSEIIAETFFQILEIFIDLKKVYFYIK